jgi:orotidine-5'-phosphate decarboxylase
LIANSSPFAGPRIIVALDFPETKLALRLADNLPPQLCRVKVGSELYVRAGPSLIEALNKKGFEVFLDLKFHDIPETVAAACRAAADLDVWMCNVHAVGGERMLAAAHRALQEKTCKPLLIAVTVLTSMGPQDLHEVGVQTSVEERVLQLARMAKFAGLDGVVCSAREAGALRRALGAEFCLVTPGIRPEGAEVDDQRRVMTPRRALEAGADYLVIGRPVTRASDPGLALRQILASIS